MAATAHGALKQGANQATRATTAAAPMGLLVSAGEVADESVSNEGLWFMKRQTVSYAYFINVQ